MEKTRSVCDALICMRNALLSFCAVVLIGAAEEAKPQPFVPGCTLPFDAIKVHHPIDDMCAARGDVPEPALAANDAGHALQNQAKNNFCALGNPIVIAFATFSRLQRNLDQKVPAAKTWNREHLPADRSGFASIYTTSAGDTIGEGSVVKFAGWVMKLRPGGKESVNCQASTKDATDLHIVLIATSDRQSTPECSSVTAEIAPHFRPDNWDAHTILSANDHPLRFTGPLMYDASHRPCSGSPPKAGSSAPARVSSWEIHPVYGIDVCMKKSLSSCKASDDSVWTPLDQWQGDEG